MATIERDVVLQSVDDSGNPTIDLPITRLGNIEDTADVKTTPTSADYVPIIDSADNGQMKKAPMSSVRDGGNADTVDNKHASDFAAVSHTHTKSDITDFPTLAAVATSGKYSDLSGTPTSLPASDTTSTYSSTGTAPVNGKAVASAISGKADSSHTHTKSQITDFPTSLPANGGDADTVSGHTVAADVPSDAKFTDTVYTHPSYTAATGVPTANATPAFGGTFSVNQVSRDATGHVSAITSRTITIPSTAATASAAGLVSTAAQTFAGNKTFNGQILPNGATAYGTQQARKLASGTAAATTTNCPSGAWYGQHS
jgi:hypothetical protein